MEPINVAFVFDDKFSDLFLVAAHSASKNTKSDLAIHVVDCGISEENCSRISKLPGKYGNIKSVKFGVPKRVDAIENCPFLGRFPSVVFYRLAIPEIFPELERVIYIDCDVVIDGDISELWGEDLGDRPLGAISEDGNFFDFKSRERHRGKLGIPMGNSCYGSGTLLINCEKFVKSKIFARVIDCIKTVQVQLSCPEQDAMNICLGRDERMSLSPRYGFCPCAPLAKMCLKKIGRPVVVHYACFKPWLMSRATVNAFHFLGLFKWQTSNFLKFWDYAAEIGFSPNSPGAVRRTLGFLFKRLFQPVERLVSKGIRDNFLAFWKKSFEQKVPWRKQ